jgi:MGT family glycosyltransferase
MKQSGPGLLSMIKSMPKINKSMKRLRDKGYAVKSVLDIIANDNDTKTIVYTSPMFQPYAETFSENYDFVGPILREAKEPIEKAELPTVYISLGTVDNAHPDFYRNCLKAMDGQPYRVILSVGTDTDIAKLGEIPSNCLVYHTVDQIAVLQCADVFLTHCGMNSVSEALYYGIPLIMFPQTPEQQGVANRVRELYAGKFLEGTTPEAIRTAVQTALTKQELKDGAIAIRQSFLQCGGAVDATDFIEKQCI